MAKAGHHGMGQGNVNGVTHVGDTSPEAFDQDDMASDLKGRHKLQGNGQDRVHNERHAVAEEKRETEGLIESFENMDPEVRANR